MDNLKKKLQVLKLPSKKKNGRDKKTKEGKDKLQCLKIPFHKHKKNPINCDNSFQGEDKPYVAPSSSNDMTKIHHTTKPGATESIMRVGPDILYGSVNTSTKVIKSSNYNHVNELVEMCIDSQSKAGIVGMRNLGNTCFMNSSVQCLSNTIPLLDYFVGYDYQSEINSENFLGSKGKLVKAYAEMMKELWLGNKTIVNPSVFKYQLGSFASQFRGNDQHDAQEFLAFLLDGIHEDLNRVKKKLYIENKYCDGKNDDDDAMFAWERYLKRDKSIVVDIFQGQMRNTMVCRNYKKKEEHGLNGCGYRNVMFEPFMYLSLPIVDDCNSLDDCLDMYCKIEKLTGDNMWYCPKCKEHVTATKEYSIWILPPILIIHLKRFKYNTLGCHTKIDKVVEYKLRNWDLSKNIKSTGKISKYDLYATINHHGILGSGHYIAHAKNRFSDDWHKFNDSICSIVNESNIRNMNSAYCLFYNRVDKDDIGTKRKKIPEVKRQSLTRPELWPHTQVTTSFREFNRKSTRKILEENT